MARDNVEIKETVIGDGEARRRCILIRNDREVEGDRRLRQELDALREALDSSVTEETVRRR